MLRPNFEKSAAAISSGNEEYFNQFLLSFRTSTVKGNANQSELVKHAVIRREKAPSSDTKTIKFHYRCGKLGPETSLMDILRYV